MRPWLALRPLRRPAIAVAVSLAGAAAMGSPGQAAESIKVGAVYATSGPAAFLGIPEERGLRLAAEELNKAGGIAGRKVEVIVYDTEGNGTKASQQLRRLIDSDKVDVVFGPSSSGESLLVLPIANEAKTPIIMHAGTEKVFTPTTPYGFNTPPSDRIVAADLLAKLKKRGITRIALMSSADGFGQSGANVLRELAKTDGIDIVRHEEFNRQDTDMTAQVLRVKASDAQALLIWSALPGPSIILKNAAAVGYQKPIFNSYAAASRDLLQQAGPAANGTYVTSMRLLAPDTLKADDPVRPVVQKLYADYKAKYGDAPATFAAHSHDALMIVKAAAEKVDGELTRDKLRDAIETVSITGANGIFQFTPDNHGGLNQNSLSMVLMQAKDGQWVVAE
ncbi:ABC transporter substrate-binding protein [Chelatococcus reniformis]|uniref:Branched-chain amino acid ABC transporter substrate-binding protein n=1 Tax=Chelatococcus reniformis TaxID=1494448 RepID=A0A916XD86_9HYPH|nr:ABC transporter substrate-binding protein [Chelatococcus reniformis]GGC65039.1 branched-chain amino acid ABC transporter substrate-binding protein [Chelatococcus reniformis]